MLDLRDTTAEDSTSTLFEMKKNLSVCDTAVHDRWSKQKEHRDAQSDARGMTSVIAAHHVNVTAVLSPKQL